MDAAKVVMHVVQSDRTCVIVQLFREGVCQPSEPPRLHPKREILTLYEASRNMLRVGAAFDAVLGNTNALRWAVTLLTCRIGAVVFDQYGVINVRTE